MKYKIKNNLILEKKNNKITIFDPDKSMIFKLNETASLILEKIKNQSGIDQIINSLTAIYKISKKQLKNRIYNVLKELVKKGIVS